MKRLIYIILPLTLLLLSSCGGEEENTINYQEAIVGTWRLDNVGDIQKYFNEREYTLKKATMVFNEDGTVQTLRLDPNSPGKNIPDGGTWKLNEDGTELNIIAKDSPFDDIIDVQFDNERTLLIDNRGLTFKFVKI
ncbi:MAG: hypothetical protein GY810_19370 [Aureispira sp.]|nr:hypothetical protein [Aureispira sp.]